MGACPTYGSIPKQATSLKICNLNDPISSTCCLEMSSHDKPQNLMNLLFPRDMGPREEMKNLFSISLTVAIALGHYSGDEVVQKPVAETKTHTAVTGIKVFAQAAEGDTPPQMSPSASNHAWEHRAAGYVFGHHRATKANTAISVPASYHRPIRGLSALQTGSDTVLSSEAHGKPLSSGYIHRPRYKVHRSSELHSHPCPV